jgi:uncharacterized protein YeaO (DUF488 family)
MVRCRRIYESPRHDDGSRVLVDRLWPRGVRRTDAALDEWLKEVAPSPALRRWFGHDPERFETFAERYRAELVDNPGVDRLRDMASRGAVTLLYAARDERHNHARVLESRLNADGTDA